MRTAPPKSDAPPVDADVIILSWNRPDDVADAIASALDRVEVSRRILVVGSGQRAAKYHAPQQLIDAKPDGELNKTPVLPGGRNIATAMGNGRHVVVLDSDAVFGVPPRWPEPSAIWTPIRTWQPSLSHRKLFYRQERRDLMGGYPGHHPDERFFSSRFVGAGHAIRRMAFEAVGGYDARLFFARRSWTSYRMLNLGYRIEYFPDVKVRQKILPCHRVAWDRGRYFFTVRNGLCTSYKFGAPLSRLGLDAAAFLARDVVNGIGRAAVSGLCAAFRMCAASGPGDKRFLPAVAGNRRYIGVREPWGTEPAITKMRRQFRRFPRHV